MTWELHLGDCIEGMRAMADKSVDQVIADPPYSERVHTRLGTEEQYDGAPWRRALEFGYLTDSALADLAKQYVRVTKRWILLFCDEITLIRWKTALEANGAEYVRKGTWVKPSPMPQMSGDRPCAGTEEIMIAHAPREKGSGRMRWNGGGKSATYTVSHQEKGRKHPTQKPISLMRQILEDFTDPGDLILDSHAGSGTTGAACIELGRSFVGWELDPKHHAIATKRLQETSRQEQMFKPQKQEQRRLAL